MAVLILLPPSEGKAASRSGAPLDLTALSLPVLTPARERVLDALMRLSRADREEEAVATLGLSPGQRDEIGRNARLREAPTLPAGRLYTGVLYEALDLATLSAPARRLANRWILILSALWGAVRLTDRIPPYRCSAGVRLPGVGGLAGYWRTVMPAALSEAAGKGPVLDLRSTPYAGMWVPAGELAGRTAAVRVLHERVVDGVRRHSVVSHFNKATKGRLVRSLATAGVRPRSTAELVVALRDLKYTVEERPGAAGKPRQLDLIVKEL